MDETTFKRLAGCLLKYYRTHLHFPPSYKRLTLKEIVRTNTTEIQELKAIYQRKLNKPFICSPAKLTAIEKGEVDHNDFVYECISTIFSKRFLYKQQFGIQLEKEIASVYAALVYPDEATLDQLLKQIDLDLDRYKDYLVYQEVLWLLRACLLYFRYFRLPTLEEALLFQALAEVDVSELGYFNELLSFILTVYAIQTKQLPLNRLPYLASNRILVIRSRYLFYLKRMQLDHAIDALKWLRLHPDYPRQCSLQFDYYSYLALALVQSHAQSKAANCLARCRFLLNRYVLLRQPYYQARLAFIQGMFHLYEQSYLQAYESFCQAQPERTYWPLPLMAYCIEKCHLPRRPFQELLSALEMPLPEGIIQAFVRYLQYKWNLIAIARADARYLEDILVEHILQKLDSDPFFYSIFYHELIELAPISKRSELLRQHQML
ncbi:MAG TPA: hypothetical protein IAD15_01850 [Candidatus Fimiplasma intestinipullorum]|uniref:Uncharacterized protein n=1 Tax=Candidatus Fimiplasma intestinipullorum TaxID=2840825 RepID=A0A9D1HLU2_9FIRM|nr:hypothetical protein [Candidatus Fimiplasma intestinipullorum]